MGTQIGLMHQHIMELGKLSASYTTSKFTWKAVTCKGIKEYSSANGKGEQYNSSLTKSTMLPHWH